MTINEIGTLQSCLSYIYLITLCNCLGGNGETNRSAVPFARLQRLIQITPYRM